MANVIRRLASVRIGKASNRQKDNNFTDSFQQNALYKERDRLLQEFLLAREELKGQFDYEKREIVSNYERRLKYLRRLIDEYEENMNMLKLNLDAEKEENFILKTKLMEKENELNKKNSHVYHNQSYEDESTLSYNDDDGCYSDEDTDGKKDWRGSTKSFLLDSPQRKCRSYSRDSIAKSSVTTESDARRDDEVTLNDEDLHQTCREEFKRLLLELRSQQTKYEKQIESMKEDMSEKIENEKLQLEKIVYKQLNLKLEKEVKKHELLFTENSHLRSTITQTFMESYLNRINTKNTDSVWRETNSDSGADVEDNRSDDESEPGDRVETFSMIKTDGFKDASTIMDIRNNDGVLKDLQGKSCSVIQDLQSKDGGVTATLLCSVLQEQKAKLSIEFQKQHLKEQTKFKTVVEHLNEEIVKLVKENRLLNEHRTNKWECLEDMSAFHMELRQSLLTLEDFLSTDEDAC